MTNQCLKPEILNIFIVLCWSNAPQEKCWSMGIARSMVKSEKLAGCDFSEIITKRAKEDLHSTSANILCSPVQASFSKETFK